MSKVIKIGLSVEGLNTLINKLSQIEVAVNKAKEDSIKEVANESLNIIISKTPVDTGATASSTHMEVKNKKVFVIQEGDHVFENEFGDGNWGREESYPVAIPGTYTFTHYSDYWFTPTDPTSKYYQTKANGKVRRLHSEGQIASAQMYHGAQYIKETLPNRIKQKVRGEISKI